MTARFIVGDVFDGIATLDDESVDLVLTSPPFLALRSYLPADHVDKQKEIGSEATPAAFIDRLLDVVEALTPKLSRYGTICIELGDTYSGSGGAGGDYAEGGLREKQPEFQGSAARNKPGYGSFAEGVRNRNGSQGGAGWPLDKSLCLIPESFRWALVYGHNPFNGRTTPRWRARNVVRWCRPNPPVGALGDKFRPGTSEMVVACKARDRWFDLDAVREPPKNGLDPSQPTGNGLYHGHPDEDSSTTRPNCVSNPAGAPPLDWWEIPTEPFRGSHYATFPKKLLDRPILAMCPQWVCRTCHGPRRRITEKSDEYAAVMADREGRVFEKVGNKPEKLRTLAADRMDADYVTLGWSDCGHGDYRRGVVLDCFAGSGTTLQVAEAHGRDSVGIDLDARNAELAVARCGMFLTVETLELPLVAGGSDGT